MAKLNGVKTLDMQNGEITRVEYNGETYVKVDGKAQAGDLASLLSGHSIIGGNVGDFYEVYIDSDGEALIPTTFGGRIDVAVKKGVGVLLRKASENNDKPKMIRITQCLDGQESVGYGLAGQGTMKVGAIGEVVAEDSRGVYVKFDDSQPSGSANSLDRERFFLRHGEYEIINNGAVQYRLVTDRKPKAGDFVKFAKDDKHSDITGGKYYEVTAVDDDGDLEFIDDVGDKSVAVFDEEEFEVYEKVGADFPPKTEKRHAKVGERILIVNAAPLDGQSYKAGDIFTVTQTGVFEKGDVHVEGQSKFIDYAEYKVIVDDPETITHNGATYTLVDRKAQPGDVVVFANDDNPDWLIRGGKPYLVTKVVKDEPSFIGEDETGYDVYHAYYNRTPANVKVYAPVEEAEPLKEENTALRIGDYAKVIKVVPDSFGGKIGDIVKIVKGIESYGGGYKVEELDGGDYRGNPNCNTKALVRATDEEAAEAKAQAEQSAKWARIGRKPNEFKKGDLVKYKSDGEICEVVEINEEGRPRVKTKSHGVCTEYTDAKSDIELITPVEARFDGVGIER